MLRAFQPYDFLPLESLLRGFCAEAPEVLGLSEAIFTAPEHLQVLPSPKGLSGFVYLPGREVKFLAGLFTRDPSQREDLLQAAIAPLQASGVLALIAPERFGSTHLAPALKALGFERLERLDVVQDLARIPISKREVPPGIRLIDWDPQRDDEAAALLSASNQGTLDGLFLCLPDPPDAPSCSTRLQAIRAGQFGPFLPEVSGMVLSGEELIGVLLATEFAEGEVFLYELALSREFQGQGLAPLLIGRLQEASRSKGYDGIRFMWCDRNRAVRRLFPPESLRSESRAACWVWRSAAYLARRRKRGSGPMGG